MRILAMLAAVMLALIGTAAPAHAQADKIAQRNAPQIVLPFNPPLDTPLRFRVTRALSRDGASATSVSWIEEARFVRNGDGYILYWRIDPASLPPATRQRRVAPMSRVITAEPLAFDVDGYGMVLRIRDWGIVRPRLANMPAEVAAVLTGVFGPGPDSELNAQLTAMFNNMSAEEAPKILIKNLYTPLGWGGVSLRVGESIEETSDQAIPMFGGSVSMKMRVTLVSADPGRTATITQRSEIDQESLAKAIRQVIGSIDVAGSADALRMREEIEQMRMLSLVDSTTLIFDLPTGLPLSFENVRTVRAGGASRVDSVRIEWLR